MNITRSPAIRDGRASLLPPMTIAQTVNTATRRDWIGLGIIALPCLLYSMDLTILNLAAPALTAALAPSGSQLLWIMDIYGFTLAGSLITMGTLGDRIGRRRLLLCGAAAFGCVSVVAAFSQNANMLIAARAILGVAGATLAPSTLSLIRNMFLDERERTLAIGIWATSFSAGAALGPVLGGVLLARFWWGSAFLVAVPIMALLLVLGPRLLPEFREPRPERLDVVSAVMSLGAILLLIYGLKRSAVDGLDAYALMSVGVGVVIAALFVRRQRGLAHPLMDLSLFRARGFSAAVAASLVGIFLVGGVFFFTAQYLQLVLELPVLGAGAWTVLPALGLVGGGLLAPMLVRRVRRAHVIAVGFALSALGQATLTQIGGPNALLLLIAGSTLVAFGVSLVIPLSTDLIVGAAPPNRAGMAASLSETATELGGALGIAMLGSLGAAVYRHEMSDSVLTGLSLETSEAARTTVGRAVAVAHRLPEGLRQTLLDAAQSAFENAMHLTAAVGAVLALTAAVIIFALLRESTSN